MQKIRCFIFDLDGTLVFNEDANAKAYQQAFKKHGLELTAKEYSNFFGRNLKDMMAQYEKDHGVPNTPELLKKIRNTKATIYADNLHLIEQNHTIVALLQALAPHYHTALATTAREVNARAVIDHFGLTQHFDYMVFGEDVTNLKPSPECHQKIAQHFNIKPEECMVFEDSTTGLAAAKAFGASICKVVQ